MVTGKSQPGLEPVHFPASPEPVPSNSPPSRRDLASWWRQFKRNTRKDDLKGTSGYTVSRAQTLALGPSSLCYNPACRFWDAKMPLSARPERPAWWRTSRPFRAPTPPPPSPPPPPPPLLSLPGPQKLPLHIKPHFGTSVLTTTRSRSPSRHLRRAA